MLAKHEKRTNDNDTVWCARWLNLKNIYHWHSETELIYCEYGTATVYIEEKVIKIVAEEAVFVREGTVHKIESAHDSVLITILIDKSIMRDITSLSPASPKLSHSPKIPEYYNTVKSEQRSKDLFSQQLISAETIKLLAEILRKEKLSEPVSNDIETKYTLYKAILEYIQVNLDHIDFKSTCHKFSYSPSHFSHLISNLTGMSFTKYLTILRIERAVSLLNEYPSMTITEIAHNCGFSTIRNFNRAFKEMTGYAPSKLPSKYKYPISFKEHAASCDPTHSISILLE